MVFNTGSALLDAIVLAVVSREPEGTYGYKITQEVRQAIDLSESTLCAGCKRTIAWRFMTWSAAAATGDIIR